MVQGKLKIGDEIEISPGQKGEKGFEPIKAKVVSLLSGSGNTLEEAYPGGLIGVGTELDPASTRADRLVGNVVGKAGKMPKAIDKMMITPQLMERVIGSESSQVWTAMQRER